MRAKQTSVVIAPTKKMTVSCLLHIPHHQDSSNKGIRESAPLTNNNDPTCTTLPFPLPVTKGSKASETKGRTSSSRPTQQPLFPL
jgi:hypothetical protein